MNSNYSAAATLYGTTSNINQNQSLSSLSFTPSVSSAKLVSTGSSINYLITSASAFTSSGFNAPIHGDSSFRGTLGGSTNLSWVTASISGATSVTGPQLDYYGFGYAGTYSAVTANNLTLTPSTPADSYSTNSGNDGYYMYSSTTLGLSAGFFSSLTSGNSQYTATVTNTVKTTGGSTSTDSKSYSFYYDDGEPGTPAINSFTLNSFTTTATQVSGVYVVRDTITASVTANIASGVGNYFYNNSQILAYTAGTGVNGNPSSESNLTNVTSSKSPNLTYPVILTNSGLSVTPSTSYNTSISLSATAYNVSGSSANSSSSSINAIVDKPSYTLITSTIPTSIPTLASSNSNNGNVGWKIYSGQYVNTISSDQNSKTNTNTITSSPTSYDHSVSIVDSGTYKYELQIANGLHQTITSATNAYLNYSTYYYGSSQNTVNYTSSTISNSGYRYATFAWKGNTSTTHNRLTITLNSLSGNSIARNGSNILQVNGLTVQLYYRIYDSTAGYSTYWVSGNDTTLLARISTSNMNNPDATTHGVPEAGFSTSTSTFTLIMPNGFTSNSYIYVVIGLPMNKQCSFSSISAYSSQA